jgi:hypothetical protein
VRILADTCSNQLGVTLAGSGFIWKMPTQVVTALHVVNGCSKLTIISDTAHSSVGGHLVKIDTNDDLALLSLSQPLTGASPVSSAEAPPQDSQALLLIGYPDDSSGITGKEIHRQFGASTLDDLASSQAKVELQQSQSPSLDTAIVFLSAAMEHGHSGGPIFNQSGQVIAIADGGLEHGATEDSWGIPATDLATLEASTQPLSDANVQNSSLLFASEKVSASGPLISCGGGNFEFLKSIGFGDIARTADDPSGLNFLVNSSGVDAHKFSFDVYQDSDLKATIVLPKGESLAGDSTRCVAANGDGTVIVRARVVRVTNDPLGNSAAFAFERDVGSLLSGGWVFNPQYSYLAALPVLGGGVAFRKNWVHYVVSPPYTQPSMDQQEFETLAFRNNIWLGVNALNSSWTPTFVMTMRACRVNQTFLSVCPQVLSDVDDWVAAILGVHLSTLVER